VTTYGDAFLKDYSTQIDKLKELTYNPYEPQQVRDILSTVGTRSEIFLKSTVLPGVSARSTFEKIVNLLPEPQMRVEDRNAIHALRILYNKAKHEPSHPIELLEALKVVTDAMQGLRRAVEQNLGLCGHVRPINLNRVYWISAGDHYTTGETEVHVHIPGTSSHWLGVPSFDHVNIAGLEWDDMKVQLASVGTLRNGAGIIPQSQIDSFVADADSLNPLVFEGSYKDLLTVLASHELRVEIMPELRREANHWSMVVGVLLATCDTALTCDDPHVLQSEITQHAVDQYAVPDDFEALHPIVESVSALIKQLPVSDWKKVQGPVWARAGEYASLANGALAQQSDLPILVAADYALVALWDHE
jgi:hypothetical protein